MNKILKRLRWYYFGLGVMALITAVFTALIWGLEHHPLITAVLVVVFVAIGLGEVIYQGVENK